MLLKGALEWDSSQVSPDYEPKIHTTALSQYNTGYIVPLLSY